MELLDEAEKVYKKRAEQLSRLPLTLMQYLRDNAHRDDMVGRGQVEGRDSCVAVDLDLECPDDSQPTRGVMVVKVGLTVLP
jgi:hypothetical protein